MRSKATCSRVPQSTQRPLLRHQTAKRTTCDAGGDGAFVTGWSPRTAARALASASARCLWPRSAWSTIVSTSSAARPSSSHQKRSRYHHQRRPSCLPTRTGSSPWDLARRANRRSEHSRWCCDEWRRKSFTARRATSISSTCLSSPCKRCRFGSSSARFTCNRLPMGAPRPSPAPSGAGASRLAGHPPARRAARRKPTCPRRAWRHEAYEALRKECPRLSR